MHSSRHQVVQVLCWRCDAQHKEELRHIPLEGTWKGRSLTSWAEDYPALLAQALCDAVEIEKVIHCVMLDRFCVIGLKGCSMCARSELFFFLNLGSIVFVGVFVFVFGGGCTLKNVLL